MNFFNDLRRVEQRIPVVSTFLQNHDFLVLGTTKHMYEFVDRGTTDVLFNYCCNKHNEKFDVDDITRHELGMYVWEHCFETEKDVFVDMFIEKHELFSTECLDQTDCINWVTRRGWYNFDTDCDRYCFDTVCSSFNYFTRRDIIVSFFRCRFFFKFLGECLPFTFNLDRTRVSNRICLRFNFFFEVFWTKRICEGIHDWLDSFEFVKHDWR